MKQYVFISYSTENTAIAQQLKKTLEAEGIKCWMAPTSIPAGSSYSTEIFDAISECNAFVLVLSRQAMDSIWVPKELDLALNNKCNILPLKIDESSLSPSFGFYLCNVQMIEAAGGDIESLKKVVSELFKMLNSGDDLSDENTKHSDNRPQLKQRFQSPSVRVMCYGPAVDKIKDELAQHDVVCIKGIAGSGKTELANIVIKQMLDENRIHRVSYNEFHDSIRETFARIPFDGISDEEIIKKYHSVYKVDDVESILFEAKKQFLLDIRSDDMLVIDGLNVYDDDDIDLIRQLPCKVLITTRCQLRDLYTVELDNYVTLKDKADAFIAACEDVEVTEDEIELVNKMVQAIKGHMLIMRLFARFISAGGYSINEFYDLIKDNKLLKVLEDEVEYNHHYRSIQSHILDVFDVSNLSDSEKSILFKMTFLPSTGVSKRLFRIWNPAGTMSIVDRLVAKGWVISDKGKISVHPAVAYSLAGIRGSLSEYSDYLQAILNYLNESTTTSIQEMWKAKDIAQFLAKTINERSAEACEVLLECGAFLDTFAYWKLYGARNLAGISSLIQVYNKKDEYQDDFKDALKCLKKALSISEKQNVNSYTVPEIVTANIINQIGCTCYNMNDFKSAVHYHGRALELRERLLEVNDDDTITSRRRLGTSYLSMGKFDKALDCYSENLSYESSKGATTDLARAFSNCGDVYRIQEDYLQAMSMYEQAIEAFCGKEENLEQDPMGLLQIIYRLSLVYSSASEHIAPEKWHNLLMLTEQIAEKVDSDLANAYVNEINSLAESRGIV